MHLRRAALFLTIFSSVPLFFAQELLKAGADPCARDGHGFTPLLEAVRRGHVSVARELYEAGAVLGLVDDVAGSLAKGGGAQGAAWAGLPGTKMGLLSAEAELSAAVQRGQLEYLRLLLSFGTNPDAADPFDGRTAARALPLTVARRHCALRPRSRAPDASAPGFACCDAPMNLWPRRGSHLLITTVRPAPC